MRSPTADILTNMAAEQGLLGSILTFNDQIFECGALTSEDFAYPVHGEIWRAAYGMVIQGSKASPMTLRMAFDGHPALENLGGSRYLTELLDGVGGLNTARDYAQIIVDLAQRRRIVEALETIKNRVMTESSSGAEILTDISRILETGQGTQIRTKRSVALDAINSVSLPPDCCRTGLDVIDKAMGGGLYAGFTYGIGGAEKRGKTTLAHTISDNLNTQGVLHAYVALEMGSVQIEQRNLARALGINSLRFLQPQTRHDTALIAKGLEMAATVKDCTLYLDMPSATLEALQVELSRLVMRHDIKGFIVDYWQLIEGQQRAETEERHLRRCAQWLANFARKHKVWCILLSQVNDEGKLFAGKGLVKACDQLYTIELGETGSDDREIWLRMTHSRYTPLVDVGSKTVPVLRINRKAGPHVEQTILTENMLDL